jgi:hypothetical protein
MSHRHPLLGELSGINDAPSQVESAPQNVFFMLHNHQISSRKLRDTTLNSTEPLTTSQSQLDIFSYPQTIEMAL